MKRIIAATLLAACSDAATPFDTIEPSVPVQLTQPKDLIGGWCNGELCIQVEATPYGAGYVFYTWSSRDCGESGFISLDSARRLQFGAIHPELGCFSRGDTKAGYLGTFTLADDGQLTVRLSVLSEPFVLSAE